MRNHFISNIWTKHRRIKSLSAVSRDFYTYLCWCFSGRMENNMGLLRNYSNAVIKRVTSFLLIVSVLASIFICGGNCYISAAQDLKTTAITDNTINYADYLSNYTETSKPDETVTLLAENVVLADGSAGKFYTDFEGKAGTSVYLKETDTAEWEFNINQTGLYELKFSYYPIDGNGNTIQRQVLIDGELPFKESENIVLSRVWVNSSDEAVYDVEGNQIMISQIEAPRWQEQCAYDVSGLTEGALKYYLEAGAHRISLVGVSEPVLINALYLQPVTELPLYSEIVTSYDKKQSANIDKSIILEGEDASAKSDQTMYPVADKTSPAVSPSNPMFVVYNAIGGTQWSNNGKWIEWSFEVETSGLYNISAHYKQASKTGAASIRKLYIDGKIPFKEAESVVFPYGNDWQTVSLSDDEGKPFLFWLESGEHTIRFEVGMGIYREALLKAKNLLTELNRIYREIVVVTGTSPDVYRNYNFEKTIPETIASIKEISAELKSLEKEFNALNSDITKNAADIKRIYIQLDEMLEDTETIAHRLSNFRDNISSYGTWINKQTGHPLTLDYISINPYDTEPKSEKVGVFGYIKYYLMQFLASFITDYDSVGNTGENYEKSIKVWLQTGRDQAQILKRLSDGNFTPESGIGVDLQLVPVNSLLPAILSHKAPDVVLNLTQAEPLNLALRNGLLDLTQFSDFNTVTQEFDSYTIDPFRFNNGVYAMPETQLFPMLFYRKDIISELGISVDKLEKWDTLLGDALPQLRRNSLYFGILPTVYNYLSMCYQMGGSLYSEDGKYSTLDSAEAIKSMEKFTMLYKQYGLPISFDFANRFRTGEMPIAIVDFTSYNQLSVFAPEIKGLWGMLPVPGIEGADGTVNHTTLSVVTGSAIISQTKDKQASWEFLKWWLSAEVQDAYGKEIESVVGSAARYNSANKLAFSRVSWDADIKQQLQKQTQSLVAYREVPGGYFSSRMFSFAFRDIVYSNKEVRDTMNETAKGINSEISRKRAEYKLDN